MSVEEDRFQDIAANLTRVEREHRVRVLYAVESGSRAWGFASSDSDYDVRFFYVHPRDWYLSIDSGRDVIEEMLPGDIDLAGWELKKALRLMRKSNPPFYEWLRSPIVYRQDERFMERLRKLAASYYSPERCFLHYLHMAQGNFKEFLQGHEVWTKKYLYVLRPVTACLWIERGLGPVPMELEKVVQRVIEDPVLLSAISDLLERKRSGTEMAKGPRIEPISASIESELPRLESLKQKPEPFPDPQALNALFRETLDAFDSR